MREGPWHAHFHSTAFPRRADQGNLKVTIDAFIHSLQLKNVATDISHNGICTTTRRHLPGEW